MDFSWTEEKTRRLKTLVEDGIPYGMIAKDLDPSGGLTRSAVAGKARRLKLSAPVRKAQAARKTVARAGSGRDHSNKSATAEPEVESKPLPKEDTTLQPTKDYADLLEGECKWPYGDGPYKACGRNCSRKTSVAFHPYCDYHRERGGSKTEKDDELELT